MSEVDVAKTERLRALADQGDTDAQCDYGLRLYKGEGVTKNLSEVAKHLKPSAEKGSTAVQNNYGLCSKRGEGFPQNLSEAMKYFKMSKD
jgi:TPR repeat protein